MCSLMREALQYAVQQQKAGGSTITTTSVSENNYQALKRLIQPERVTGFMLACKLDLDENSVVAVVHKET